MRDLYNKANAPYLIAGALATLVLLASGTLAVAPYVAFLSSIAAFNVALPVALSLSILSVLVLALSCKIISNNKKIEVEKNKFAEKEQKLEAVDKFMQPIYEKLGINNQLDISSEHSSEFEGTGENTSANEQFLKPKLPYISIPIRPPYTELNDASCDFGYASGCSTPTNSYHTF